MPSGPPPPIPTPGTGVGARATFGSRLGATIIDWLIFSLPFSIFQFILVEVLPRGDFEACTIGGQAGICETLSGPSQAVLLLISLAYLAFVVFYWWGTLIGKNGVTPGRNALNIKVVDKQTGTPIGMGRGIGRGLFSIISAVICFIGYLWMLWDKDKQTLHDKVTNAVVIRN